MTINQTINDVPRALLESLYTDTVQQWGVGGNAAGQLRALLDAPAKCDKCYGAGKIQIFTVCGATHKTCECSKPRR